MKMILSPGKSGHNVALCGILCTAALMLSYFESFVPLAALTGIPGIRLGLANIAVIVVLYTVGWREAVLVSLLRIFLSALLFGSVTSLAFAICGGILAFCALFVTRRCYGRVFSMIGISMFAAAAHNTGQIIAASLLMQDAGLFAYLPVLLLAAVPCGALTGVAAELTVGQIRKIRTVDKR